MSEMNRPLGLGRSSGADAGMGAGPIVSVPADNPQAVLTAIHEAGHALPRIDSGLLFDHVTIVPDGDTLGEVVVTPRMGSVVDWAISSAAGPAAEAYALALEDPDGGDEDPSLVSLAAALCLASARHPEVVEAEEKLPGITGWIVDLVAASWPRITRLADALLASPTGTLTYSECQLVVAAKVEEVLA